MEFDPLEEALDEPLVLPLRGADGTVRKYEIPPCTAEAWLRMHVARKVGYALSTGQEPAEGDLSAILSRSEMTALADSLGAQVVEQMITDGVAAKALQRAAMTALAYHLDGAEAAQQVWSDTPTKPRPDNPSESGTSRSSSGTAAASRTRRVSTSGTRARKAKPSS